MAQAKRLVVFDVDGTFIKTNGVDSECFVQAVADEFGIRGFNTRWNDYEHSTNSGVFQELFLAHRGRLPSTDELDCMQSRFVERLSQRFDQCPDDFAQISGASEMLREYTEMVG